MANLCQRCRERGGAARRQLPGGRRGGASLGAGVLILVCGPALDGDLARADTQVLAGIERLAPYAAALGVRLGIEPLHPMMAAERSVIVVLAQALDLAGGIPTSLPDSVATPVGSRAITSPTGSCRRRAR